MVIDVRVSREGGGGVFNGAGINHHHDGGDMVKVVDRNTTAEYTSTLDKVATS